MFQIHGDKTNILLDPLKFYYAMDRYSWGLGSMGQLGHYSLKSVDKVLLPRRVVSLEWMCVESVGCGGVHTCAVTTTGALYAWGGGQVGQLGIGPRTGFFSCTPGDSDSMSRNLPVLVISTGVLRVACGHSHTLVLTGDGRIYGWGYNGYGQAANQKSTYACHPSPVDWYLISITFFFFYTNKTILSLNNYICCLGVLVKCGNWQLEVAILRH